MRPAAELLLVEAVAIRPLLAGLTPDDTHRPTVCTGWSVRDVLAHCGAALTMTSAQALHGFTPDENEADVGVRRAWAFDDVLDELFRGYAAAAFEIERAGGALDGIGLGEWVHGGDVREAIEAPRPYTSDGVDLAFDLFLERSASQDKPGIDVVVDDTEAHFGRQEGIAIGTLTTDLETFVRLCGGRRPDPARYDLAGATPADLVLFS